MKSRIRILALLAVLLVVFGPAVHAQGVQSIRTEPIITTAAPGERFRLDLRYATDPAAAELTGLGLRLHYNDAALEFSFATSSAQFLEIASTSQPDTADHDNNPETDRFVVLIAADPDAAWPGFAEGILGAVRLTPRPGFAGITTVGFSATSTPVGWALSDIPATIADPDIEIPPPSVSIEKRWISVDGSPGIGFGDDAFFEITVVNEGLIGIDDLAVDDPLSPDCSRSDIPRLLAGEQFTYQCALSGVIASFVNEATVTGIALDAAQGTPVSAADTAAVTVLDPLLDASIAPPTQTVEVGDTASFEITLHNASGETITGIEVDSDSVPDCDLALDPLAPGETLTYACDRIATADFTNTIAVSALLGSPPERKQVDLATAEVRAVTPSVALTKQAGVEIAEAGDDVEFAFTLTNTGDITLDSVQVDDPLLPACNRSFSGLASGSTVEWTCVLTGIQQSITNTATASATPAVGDVVQDADSATVSVIPEVFSDGFEAAPAP